jgi:ABC-type multidrug transport system ATPase subunit
MTVDAPRPNVVVLEDVVKRYGRRSALDGLSLAVPRGAACAVIGPNGSGKTTLFAVIAGLLRVNAGRVDVFGEGPFQARRHAGRLGLMPQDSAPSPHASLLQSLCHYAELGGMTPGAARQEAELWLGRMRLGERARSRPGELSHGMRRRLSVAQAFLGSPELVLLDEPTAGLDPELAAEMRGLFVERRGQATLLISSHILSELEDVCDHAVFIEQGRLVRQGSMRQLLQSDTLVRLKLTRQPDLDALRQRVGALALDWAAPTLDVRLRGDQPIEAANAKLLRELLDQNVGILELGTGQSLEQSYLATRRAPRP